jgi:hypothetical protein
LGVLLKRRDIIDGDGEAVCSQAQGDGTSNSSAAVVSGLIEVSYRIYLAPVTCGCVILWPMRKEVLTRTTLPSDLSLMLRSFVVAFGAGILGGFRRIIVESRGSVGIRQRWLFLDRGKQQLWQEEPHSAAKILGPRSRLPNQSRAQRRAHWGRRRHPEGVKLATKISDACKARGHGERTPNSSRMAQPIRWACVCSRGLPTATQSTFAQPNIVQVHATAS